MPNWRPIPFVRLLLPLILGICLQDSFQFQKSIRPFTFILASLLIVLAFLSLSKITWKRRWIFGFFINFTLAISGILLTFFYQENNRVHHFSRAVNTKTHLQARILEIAPKNKNLKLVLAIEAMKAADEKTANAHGRLLAYLPIDVNSRELKIGDYLNFQAYISNIKPPLNPKAFNFARYLHTQNIHYQVFINETDWLKLESEPLFSISKIAHQIQAKCLHILQKHLPSANEYAVGSALILGYKPNLDSNIKSAYADTGAMHVLAVSGLHTGFIYLAIGFLLRLLPFRSKKWDWIKAILLVLGLWAFALITGGSPSVLRSASMFSFIAIGIAINRHSNIYNTLAASAFCLLLYDPFLIFAPGFQLSYLAVAGIIYFQPLIYRLWHIKNKVGDFFWQLIGVSGAAQLSTFPLSLFYFHKVPLYFWLSGLIVVPGAMIILPLGLLLFAFDKVPLIGYLLGKILYGIIWLMNSLIFLLQQLPGTFFDGVWISGFVFLLICFLIIALIFIIESRKAKWVLAGLSTLCLILGMNIQKEWSSLNQKELIIYHQKNNTLIDVFDGQQSFTFSTLDFDNPVVNFTVQNYHWYKKVKTIAFNPIECSFQNEHFIFQNGYLEFENLKLSIINNKIPLPKTKIQIDNILLTQNAQVSIAELVEIFDCKNIIIDASNYKKQALKWQAECAALAIECYNIGEQGAWIKNVLDKEK